jgi:cell division protein FtsB
MKKIFFFVVLIFSVFVINNLVRSIYNLSQKQDLVVDAEKDLIAQIQENERLKSELAFVESEEFVEEMARNRLLLIKPGEQEVIVPEELIKGTSSPSAKLQEEIPNWKKWWELFF